MEDNTTELPTAVTDTAEEYTMSTTQDNTFTNLKETSGLAASTEKNALVNNKRKRVKQKHPHDTPAYTKEVINSLNRSESRFESELNLFPFFKDNSTSNDKIRLKNRSRDRKFLGIPNISATELFTTNNTLSMDLTTSVVSSTDYSDTTVYTVTESSTLGSEETIPPEYISQTAEKNISTRRENLPIIQTVTNPTNTSIVVGGNKNASDNSAEIGFVKNEFEITKSITFRNETRRTLKTLRRIPTEILKNRTENGTSLESKVQETTIIILNPERSTQRRKKKPKRKNTTEQSPTDAIKLMTMTVQQDIMTTTNMFEESEATTIEEDSEITTSSSINETTVLATTQPPRISKSTNRDFQKENYSTVTSTLQQASLDRMTLRERRHKHKFQRQGAGSILTLKVSPIRVYNTTLSEKSKVEVNTDLESFSITTEMAVSNTSTKSGAKVIRKRSADSASIRPPPKFSSISDPTRSHRFVAGSTKKRISQGYPRTLTPGSQNVRTKYRNKYNRNVGIKEQIRSNVSEHEAVSKLRILEDTKDFVWPITNSSVILDSETSSERITAPFTAVYSETEYPAVNQKQIIERDSTILPKLIYSLFVDTTARPFTEEKFTISDSAREEKTVPEKLIFPLNEHFGEISYSTNKKPILGDFTNAITASVDQTYSSNSFERKRGRTRAATQSYTARSTEYPIVPSSNIASYSVHTNEEQSHSENLRGSVTTHSSHTTAEQSYREYPDGMAESYPSPTAEQSYRSYLGGMAESYPSPPAEQSYRNYPGGMAESYSPPTAEQSYRENPDGMAASYSSPTSEKPFTDYTSGIYYSSQAAVQSHSESPRAMVTNMMKKTTIHPRAKTTTKGKSDNRSNSFVDAVTRRANNLLAAVQQAVAVVLEVPKQLWLLPARLGLYPETESPMSYSTTQSTWW
ncbi:uncharacterized protein [Periplaneta americana]|uniref:uncharacterized protein n=1 Tax=Periplaneta americana TaxID=6978 RepID=UPI0037E7C147